MSNKQKKKPIIKYLLISVGVLFVIAIVGKSTGIIGKEEAIEVYAEKVSTRNIIETVAASGKIQPEVEVKISPDVSGEVIELYVKEGQSVVEGQLLARIRPDVYQSIVERSSATVNSAKANYENAVSRYEQAVSQFKRTEASYNRTAQLKKDGIVSAAEFETALSSYEVAKAEVEAAKKSVESAKYNVESSKAALSEANSNLSRTTIYAPVSGTISKLSVEKGERVLGTTQMTGTEMMRISNLNSMEVNVDVNENDINRVHLNDSAIIEIDAIRGKKFRGIVTEIANSAKSTGALTDQVTNFEVKVRILEKDPETLTSFRPGLSASVDIQTKRVNNVLSIPIQAVTTREEIKKDSSIASLGPPKEEEENVKKKSEDLEKIKEYVFVVKDGKVEQREVKTGIQDEAYIQVIEGIKDNEQVVVAPYSAVSKRLKNNAVIKLVDKEDLFSSEGVE